MPTIRTEAIILRCVDFGESDRILHLLVPESGRLPVIAKGARRSVRRFPGSLDLFNHVRVQVEQRRSTGLARLDQAALLEPFTALREGSSRFALGCYLLELLDRMAPEGGVRHDMRRLFEFGLGALAALSTRTPDARLRALFELRALEALGLRPELSRCVRCGAAATGSTVAFHVAEGGTVCTPCAARLEGSFPVHAGTLRALEQALRLDLEKLDRLSLGAASLAEARHILDRFRRFHVGVQLRSEPYLDWTLAPRGSARGASGEVAGDAPAS